MNGHVEKKGKGGTPFESKYSSGMISQVFFTFLSNIAIFHAVVQSTTRD